jgi:hypothetical protein
MTAFMVWRLVIDLGFLGSVIFFCFKYAKLSTLSQVESVIELEGSLRRLMQEAQASGAQLSDVLVKRQTNIEKLMVDMQAVEQRIKRFATAAELSAAQSNRPQPELQVAKPEILSQPLASQIVTEVVKIPEQPKAEVVVPQTIELPEPVLNDQPVITAAPAAQGKQYNIFGEEITPKPSTPLMSTAAPAPRLVTKVEREILSEVVQPKKIAPYEEASSPAKDIQRVYSAAEELLKAGKEVEYVAFRTKLPVGDVQMLATMLEREQEVPAPTPEVAAISEDPRLGVLGSIKRQVQTI